MIASKLGYLDVVNALLQDKDNDAVNATSTGGK